MPKKTRGRMITVGISESEGFAALSKEAAVLFCLLIPHYNSHGKMIGDEGYIKSVVCPNINYISRSKIVKLLEEIDKNTNVKLVFHKKRKYLHAVNFLTDHQVLDFTRLGEDLLPSYSGPTPDQVVPEVEVEVEDLSIRQEVQPETDEVYASRCKQFYNEMMEDKHGPLVPTWEKLYGDAINVPPALFSASTWLIENTRNRKKDFKKFYGNWLRNQYTRATQPKPTRGGR